MLQKCISGDTLCYSRGADDARGILMALLQEKKVVHITE